jgi:hypothetical protein
MMLAETVQGTMRRAFLVPAIGDLPARRLGVVTGSVIVFVVAYLFVRSIGARSAAQRFGVGLLWVALTLAFEFGLGAVLGNSWEQMFSDYEPQRGGWMLFGLLFMLFAPALAASVRRSDSTGTTVRR